MLKLLGITAITALAPKIVDKVSEYCEQAFDYIFNGEKEENKPTLVKLRKPSDTTKITQQMAEYIREYHASSNGTGLEDTAVLNAKLGLNKSRAAYTRIWHPDFNPSNLTQGDEIE